MWSIEQLYIELGKKYDLGCSHYKNKRTLFNDLIFSDGFGGGDENVVKKVRHQKSEHIMYLFLWVNHKQRSRRQQNTTSFTVKGHRSLNLFSFVHIGGFHLHLLVFPFIYQFNSRIRVLVNSHHLQMTSPEGILTMFQHHFKVCLLWFLHEKDCSFYTHLFCCSEMR